jgi:hypothetical protein
VLTGKRRLQAGALTEASRQERGLVTSACYGCTCSKSVVCVLLSERQAREAHRAR